MVAHNHRLVVRNLSNHILHEVSFHLAAGELVCLRGPSGAGKSRLVRAICDLDISSGEVRLDGIRREEVPAPTWRRWAALLPPESVWWEERVSAHFHGAPTPAVERLGLDAEVFQWPVARLSSGERQRLALLRVLALEPKVLLLDEPTSNLDADNQRRMERLVRDQARESGAAVLWITHDDAQARRIADRIIAMRNGRLT